MLELLFKNHLGTWCYCVSLLAMELLLLLLVRRKAYFDKVSGKIETILKSGT